MSGEKTIRTPDATNTPTTTNGNGGNNEKVHRANTTDTSRTAVSQGLPFAPHTAPSTKVLEALTSDDRKGLSEDDAKKRVETYGLNRLKPPKRPSPAKIVARQFGNAMSLVLSESLRAMVVDADAAICDG